VLMEFEICMLLRRAAIVIIIYIYNSLITLRKYFNIVICSVNPFYFNDKPVF
jgi:hypothetical protein